MSLALTVTLQRGPFRLDAALEAPPASITAIFGPSGSGKTTLLRVIAGLVSDAQGTITVGGQPWHRGDLVLPAHRRRVGYVPQAPTLFSHLDVRGNLLFGARRRGTERRLADVVAMLELESLLARQPTALSGGEQRRVSLGRALLANPAVLLLDEPLSGLDDARKEPVYPFLERLHRELDIPVVLVTHNTDELLRLADGVARMRAGRLDPLRPLNGFDDGSERGPWSVIECRVAGYDPTDRLLELAVGSERLVASCAARPEASHLRAIIAASDVSIAGDRGGASSILNRVPSRILKVEPKQSHAIVSLALGPHIVKARVSLRSIREMQVAVGTRVFAQIKAVAVRSARIGG